MSADESPKSWKRTAKFVGLPLLVFVLLQADGCYPLLRFSNDLANLTVGTLGFVLPFLTVILAFVIPRRWLTSIVITVSLLPVLCFSAAALLYQGVIAGHAFRTGVNPAFERIATVPMGGYSVAIYVSDCGAPCSLGVDLLQEKAIIPGILLVRPLDGFDDAGDPTYKVIGPDTLMVSIPAYVDNDRPWESIPARSKTYHLKPFLYF